MAQVFIQIRNVEWGGEENSFHHHEINRKATKQKKYSSCRRKFKSMLLGQLLVDLLLQSHHFYFSYIFQDKIQD